MRGQRSRYNGAFKAKVAVEAVREQKTLQEIAGKYGVHPAQISKWKKQALEELPKIMSDRRSRAEKSEEELKSSLYEQIGQLKVELDWLKKKSGLID